jgi:hypothetical protein
MDLLSRTCHHRVAQRASQSHRASSERQPAQRVEDGERDREEAERARLVRRAERDGYGVQKRHDPEADLAAVERRGAALRE